MENISFAPGSRVLIRDEEWIVRRIDRTSTGANALSVLGVSDLVRDKEAIFLTDIEKDIKIIQPEDIEAVRDSSSRYIQARLYIESLLRQTPPGDGKLYISQYAAIDSNSYQRDTSGNNAQGERFGI